MNAQGSFGSPIDVQNVKSEADDFKSSVQSSNQFFHPIQVSEKVNPFEQRYREEGKEQTAEPLNDKNLSSKKDDSSDDLDKEPDFLGQIAAQVESARQSARNSLLVQEDITNKEYKEEVREHSIRADVSLDQTTNQDKKNAQFVMLNRSMNSKLQSSMILDSRRTSEALLMQPRSSFMNNFGFRGK